jgi:hypothetical protein
MTEPSGSASDSRVESHPPSKKTTWDCAVDWGCTTAWPHHHTRPSMTHVPLNLRTECSLPCPQCTLHSMPVTPTASWPPRPSVPGPFFTDQLLRHFELFTLKAKAMRLLFHALSPVLTTPPWLATLWTLSGCVATHTLTMVYLHHRTQDAGQTFHTS